MINLIQWRITIGCYGLNILVISTLIMDLLHTALSNFTVIDVAVLHIALFELYVACILLLCSSDIETNPGPVILKFIYIRKKYRIAQNFDGGKV